MTASSAGLHAGAREAHVRRLLHVPLPRALWKPAGLYARFTGVLHFSEPDAMGCLFTLRQARAHLYDVDPMARTSMVFDGTRSPPWSRPDGT